VKDTVIAARGLTKRYGTVVAIDALDLEVPMGVSLGVLGPAGSGKSTLVRLLAGLVHPSAGTLTIGGSPAGSVAARRRLGVVLQEARLYDWMTARESLAFAADLAGMPGAHIASRIKEVASELAIDGQLDRRVGELAAPMRGRLGTAMALVGEPEVLLLDEPFQTLDPEARHEVRGVLAALRGRTTIVLAAHRLADIEALCDRLAVLDAGRLVLAASVPDFAQRVAGAYVIETGGAGGLALAGLVARLRAEPWVVDVAMTGGTLRVAVSDDARAARELLPAVAGTGVPVAAFGREPQSIEGLLAGLPRS
jgi:ABC-2 type transport system ATP-binding protein